MRTAIIGMIALALFVGGCGVNKDYVSQEITASEARTAAQIGAVDGKADANAAEMARLKTLAAQIEGKADMALNKAKGFESYQIIWSGEINFPYDSWEIDGTAASILDEAGAKMEEVGGSLIEIAGHTDKSGTARYNAMLGSQRAESTKRYLADKFGISLYRMFVVSFGEEKPIAMPDERNASSRNRRCTLNIWGTL